MELKELQVKTRQMAGGPTPKALRRQGFVPAIVYGHKNDPLPLAVDDHAFHLLLKDAGQQALLSLVIDGGAASKTVMLKELQRHPVSLKLIHADFHEVDLTKKVTTYVSVATTGVCKGEKEGGVLQLIRRELEVRCLPGLIPEAITIDIGALEIGDSVHVADIKAPEGVELVHEVNFTVIAVAAPTKETSAEEEEEALEEGADAAETEEGGDE